MSRRRVRGARKAEMKAKAMKPDPDQKLRDELIAAGVPSFAVQGERIRSYSSATFADLKERRQVLRVCYPNTVDKWLDEGGPGFEEPQKRAIQHCRTLWACAGSAGRQVANYGGMATSECGREWDSLSQTEALAQLARYRQDIPIVYWRVFENMARDDFGAGEAGKLFAGNTPQRIAHAKSSVGFVASLIAQWRGF